MSIGNLGLLGIAVPQNGAVGVAFNVATQIGTTLALALAGKRRRPIPTWSFTTDELDAPNVPQAVVGQFPVTDVSERISTTWVDLPLHGVAQQPSRWVGGENGRLDVELELHATNASESVEGQIQILRHLTQPDPAIGRPPRVLFESGSYTFSGVVIEVAIRTHQPRDDGSIRMAAISVSMKEIGRPPRPLLPTDPGKPPARSRWHVVRRGEDFEQIAKKEYGDARFAVPLRQDHLMAFPAAGDRVFLSSRSFYQRRALAPDSFFLSADPSVLGPYLDLLDARGGVAAVKG